MAKAKAREFGVLALEYPDHAETSHEDLQNLLFVIASETEFSQCGDGHHVLDVEDLAPRIEARLVVPGLLPQVDAEHLRFRGSGDADPAGTRSAARGFGPSRIDAR
jgi:hypothetical protein